MRAEFEFETGDAVKIRRPFEVPGGSDVDRLLSEQGRVVTTGRGGVLVAHNAFQKINPSRGFRAWWLPPHYLEKL